MAIPQVANGAVQIFSATFAVGMVRVYSDQCTDGMTFLISPPRISRVHNTLKPEPPQQTSNGKPSNQICAVELDSSQNQSSATTSAVMTTKAAIDINSLTSTEARPSGFYDDKSNGVFNNLSLVSRKEMQVLGINRPAPDIDITKLPKLPRIGPKPQPKFMPIATATFIFLVGTTIYNSIDAEAKEDLGRCIKAGVLPVSKLDVLVKRVSHESKQGIKEFVAEIVAISATATSSSYSVIVGEKVNFYWSMTIFQMVVLTSTYIIKKRRREC
uniref:Legume lectin domain-containing protein n=1 Tax=Aegilops tauschii TaxID=37682 RepID=R7W729_AEGTA